jgi:hypothetical protein
MFFVPGTPTTIPWDMKDYSLYVVKKIDNFFCTRYEYGVPTTIPWDTKDYSPYVVPNPDDPNY